MLRQLLEATTGVRAKTGTIIRCALGLMDSDHDGSITRDELKIYASKARPGNPAR